MSKLAKTITGPPLYVVEQTGEHCWKVTLPDGSVGFFADRATVDAIMEALNIWVSGAEVDDLTGWHFYPPTGEEGEPDGPE